MFRLLLLAILLAGCASDPEKIYKPAPSSPSYPVTVSWAHKLQEIGQDKFTRLVPAVTDQFVLVADIAGNLSKYKIDDGGLIWSKSFGTTFSAGPIVYGDVVLVGSKKAEVMSVSLETGDTIWKQTVSSEVLAPPQKSGNMIVVQTNDEKMFGLNAETGNKVWVYDRNVPLLTLRGNSTPVIANDQVFAAFASGKVIALALSDGKLVWESTVSLPKGRTELERLIDVDGPVVYENGVLYVSAYRGRVAAIDASSGRIMWTREMSSHLGVTVSGSYVYLTDSQGRVWSLNRESGATLWMQDKLAELANTLPAVQGDRVIVGDVTGEVYWLDKNDGRLMGHLAHDIVSKISRATFYVDELEDPGYFKQRRDETSVIFQANVTAKNIFVTYQNGILASISAVESK